MSFPEGPAGLAVSACLLAAPAVFLARCAGRAGADRLFVALATALVSLGAATVSTSALGALRPGPFLAAQAVLGAIAVLLARGTSPPPSPRVPRDRPPRDPVVVLAWAATGLLAAGSLVLQLAEPVAGWDDRMYHASRAAYWLQNGSVLPFPTHNERQAAFPIGSELAFLWPLLFVRVEWLARLVFWLALPLLLAAAAVLLRSLRAGRRGVALGVLGVAGTPLVLGSARGLAPELWLALSLAGLAWAASRCAVAGAAPRRTFLAGLFGALALGVKATALPAVGLLAAAAAAGLFRPRWRRASAALLGGLALGSLSSGVAVVFAANAARDGHTLGSAGFRKLHVADVSPRQLGVHAARTAFLLAELPWLPEGPARRSVEAAGQALARASGASAPLTLEATKTWLGTFRFEAPVFAERFSLLGAVWLPLLLGAGVFVARRLLSRRGRSFREPLVLLALLELALVVPLLAGVRWMANARVPERFLVAPFVLAVVLGAAWLAAAGRRRPWLATAAAALVGLQAAPSAWSAVARAVERLERPIPAAYLDEPFVAALASLPDGARLLLLADQDSRDYPLFLPRQGFRNEVVPWGRGPVTAEAIRTRAAAVSATHVLLTSDEQLSFEWDPPVPTAAAVAALRDDPAFLEVPLASGRMRLFERAGQVASSAVPCEVRFLGGWYAVERKDGRWWRWSPGRGELWVHSTAEGEANLLLQLLTAHVPDRVTVSVNGMPAGAVDVAWGGFGRARSVRFPLRAGTSVVTLESAAGPVAEGKAGRRLAVAVRDLALLPPTPDPGPCLVRAGAEEP